jgi:hypothetical protein
VEVATNRESIVEIRTEEVLAEPVTAKVLHAKTMMGGAGNLAK